ncbi:MAG: hypothetical protein AAF921_25045 [Cyanobacteria bacterium P01_D01_bin.44]
MASTAQLSIGRVEKLLTRSIKQVLVENGIKTSTRSGNKELTFTVKQIASAPFASEANVKKVGAAMGEKMVELSKQHNKQNLDAGAVRQLRFKKNWTAEFDIPEALTVEPVSKKAKKSAQTVIIKPMEPVKAAPEPEPVSEPAVDATAADEAAPAEIVDEVGKDIEEDDAVAVGVADGEDGEVSAIESEVASSEISDDAESTEQARTEAPGTEETEETVVTSSEISDDAESTEQVQTKAPDTEETEEAVEAEEEEEPAVAAVVEEEVDAPQADAPGDEVDADTTADATVDDENIDDEIVDVEVADVEVADVEAVDDEDEDDQAPKTVS